ncbi:DUF6283 family protein [Nocardia puris]|uniref:DUF6283 family protein n=1 Tax=Nocardia puris TaxID=208602 RepID=UPI002E230A69
MTGDRAVPGDGPAPGPETMGPPAPRPCDSCPYRRDVPSGVWHASEYEKLRAYDRADLAEQPVALFQCHQVDADSDRRRVCAGWAGCHGDTLALRVALIEQRISPRTFQAAIDYRSPTPLFASASEAADQWQADVPRPGAQAVAAIAKIRRHRSDLTT